MLVRMLVQPMLRTDGWHQYLSDFDFRNGSKADERGHRPGGPHLGVKQTKSGAKQTSPLEGRLSEVEIL